MRRLAAALLLFGVTWALSAPAEPAQVAAEPERNAAPGCTEPAADEALRQVVEELQEEGERFEAWELELAEREQAAEELEAEARRLLDEVDAIRVAIEARLAEWEEQAGEPVQRLAKVYAAMPPAHAARLLEQLDLDLATAIVSTMKYKQSAAVLSAMSAPTALRVSRRAAAPLQGAAAEAEAKP